MNYNNLNRFIAMRTEKFFSIRLTLVSLFMLISATMMAQVTVTGTVIDMQGEPIPGASVRESGTRSAAVTDVDGKYAISVQDPNAILNVSFIGYQTQTVRIAGRKLVTITLEDDETALKDIVIVGYGTMKKNDVTGAVSVVDTKEMMKKVPTNIAQALQGLAGGVYVSQQDGAPEANTQIRIRGVGTVFGSPLPLYVVDGVKVGTNANFLNPADIETLEILKDASATAIYGSEGANGVIMITTKHGQAGRTEFSFNVDCGIGTLPYRLDVIGIDELAVAIRKSRENDNATLANKIWEKQYDGQRNTIDWQDQMIQMSVKQQYGMTILGGNEKTQYNFSLNYLDNKGLVVNTDYSRFTGRVGVKSSLTDFIEAGGDINFTNMGSYLVGTGWERLISMHDFTKTQQKSANWGVRDDITFDSLYHIATTTKRPFLLGFSTLSSHVPWDVPIHEMDDEVENAFRYLDNCLGSFIQKLQKTDEWENTLVIMLPDHGHRSAQIGETSPLLSHIPMIWVGGAVRAPKKISTICNQSDLAATLLGQLGLNHEDYIYSRDVLSSTYLYPLAVHNYNNAQSMIDSTGFILYDFDAKRFVVQDSKDGERMLKVSKAILQETTHNLKNR